MDAILIVLWGVAIGLIILFIYMIKNHIKLEIEDSSDISRSTTYLVNKNLRN